MNRSINFIGIDVDDKCFHGYVINSADQSGRAFRCRPSAGVLIKKLNQFKGEGVDLKVCYEATYIGFTLHRALKTAGIECAVIAPSLIPRVPGKKVKTDRLDAKKLAEYFINGQLIQVHVPNEEEERIRSFVRTRKFFCDQLKALKLHILSACRLTGINYNEGGSKKSYWVKMHLNWLRREIKKTGNKAVMMNMAYLLDQLELSQQNISKYDDEIEKIAMSEPYKEIVDALCCYRGIKILTAMTLVTEIGDIRRFDHPKRLCSLSGLDLREYSSGGHEKKFGITKMGNRHIRTSVIEACQTAWNVPTVSKRLKASRDGIDGKYIGIADRCMKRLHKKAHRLTHRGKERNKVKVACAREMLCFIWETMHAVAA